MPTEAQRVIKFIETFCTLGKSYKGEPFKLLDFQKEVINDVYAPDPMRDGRRLRKEYLLGVPRKNGKSQLAAGFAVYHLFADPHNKAPEVISAAGDRQQAKIVFNEAKRMILASPALMKHAKVYKDHIETTAGGLYRAVSADAGLQQGLNPSFVVYDELHVAKDNDLLVALTMGSATRTSPLFFYITTAGSNEQSPLGRLYKRGRRIETGEEAPDPRFGFKWYGPHDREEIDPDNRTLWYQYNPAHEIMVDFEDEMASSRRSSLQNEFIRFRLNGWTSTESAWLPYGAWSRLYDPARKLQPGEEVILGFDGAITKDTTALVAVRMSDRHITVLNHWKPDYGNRDWQAPVLDIADAIRKACMVYDVREVVCDPWRYQEMLIALANEGLPIVEFKTNYIGRMSPAIKGFYEAVITGSISHDGNPHLAAHMNNCQISETTAGLRLGKVHKNSDRCIDLAVASVIALHRLNYFEPAEDPRVSTFFTL